MLNVNNLVVLIEEYANSKAALSVAMRDAADKGARHHFMVQQDAEDRFHDAGDALAKLLADL